MAVALPIVSRLGRLGDRLFNRSGQGPLRQRLRRARFSRPAMVILENGEHLFASSRDISKRGIGLSHEHVLPLGKLKMNVDVGGGRYMQVRAKILWSRQLAEGQYISGGEFLAVPKVLPTTDRRGSRVVAAVA
jgi:PilZ domain